MILPSAVAVFMRFACPALFTPFPDPLEEDEGHDGNGNCCQEIDVSFGEKRLNKF